MSFSFYDILNEADDDNPGSTPDNSGLPEINDDDFNIDASLDNNDTSSDGGDQQDTADTTDQDDTDISTRDETSGEDNQSGEEEEENKNDSDMFYSLSAEEQQLKIMELKKLFSNLYSSCNDLIERINDLDVSEDNIKQIGRISAVMNDARDYIADYIIHIFPSRSFIENDIAFNKFLMIINSVSNVLDKIITKELKDNDTK